MSTSPTPGVVTVFLAGVFLVLGGCDTAEEPTEPMQEPMETPAAPGAERMPPAGTEPQEPATPPTGGSMQEPPSPQTAQAPAGEEGATTQAPVAAQPAAGGDAEQAMQTAGCFACHDVNQKKIGPAYTWVASRYKDDPNAVDTLVTSVKNGSTGKWTAQTGAVPMPPNLQLSEDQIRSMVQWILDQEPQEPPGG